MSKSIVLHAINNRPVVDDGTALIVPFERDQIVSDGRSLFSVVEPVGEHVACRPLRGEMTRWIVTTELYPIVEIVEETITTTTTTTTRRETRRL